MIFLYFILRDQTSSSSMTPGWWSLTFPRERCSQAPDVTHSQTFQTDRLKKSINNQMHMYLTETQWAVWSLNRTNTHEIQLLQTRSKSYPCVVWDPIKIVIQIFRNGFKQCSQQNLQQCLKFVCMSDIHSVTNDVWAVSDSIIYCSIVHKYCKYSNVFGASL